MDLSKISIKLRPRNGYAAIDLGTRMAQNNLKLMISSFIAVSLPLYLVLLFVFPEKPMLVAFVIWWLKPLWERPLLFILSRDVFHQTTSFKEVMKFSVTASFKQWFQSITWRRFSPTRSFDAPIVQLENLSGAARKERLMALHSRSPSSISGMTIMMHLVEFLIAVGSMIFILQFIPTRNVEWLIFLENLVTNTGLNLYYLLLSIGWYIAMVILAPFYVAGGFSSYLNQRSIREAWDLELIFRQMARKHKPRQFEYKHMILTFALCLLLPVFTIQAAEADKKEVTQPDPYVQQKLKTKRDIERIQSGPDYRRIEQDWKLRRLDSKDDNNKEDSSSSDSSGINNGTAKLLSWIVIALLAIYLIYKLPAIVDYVRSGSRNKNLEIDNKVKPEQLFGLDLKQESLPEDIVKEAKDLWHASAPRAAVGLLYRASLSKLIHEYDCGFEDGFTELECLLIVKNKQLPLANYFSALTETWRLLAYGHKSPTEATFIELADQWQSNFELELKSDVTKEQTDV